MVLSGSDASELAVWLDYSATILPGTDAVALLAKPAIVAWLDGRVANGGTAAQLQVGVGQPGHWPACSRIPACPRCRTHLPDGLPHIFTAPIPAHPTSPHAGRLPPPPPPPWPSFPAPPPWAPAAAPPPPPPLTAPDPTWAPAGGPCALRLRLPQANPVLRLHMLAAMHPLPPPAPHSCRALSYAWSMASAASQLTELEAAAAAASGPRLVLPAELVGQLGAGTYSLRLTVTNWLGATGVLGWAGLGRAGGHARGQRQQGLLFGVSALCAA